MSSQPLSPEKQAEVDDLARAIRDAVDVEISELAAELAGTDDAHLFGDHEFKIRALAHKIAAKALQQHLEKKSGYQGASVTGPHCGQAAEFHSHRPHTPLRRTKENQRSAKELKFRRFPITPLQLGQE